MRARKHSSKIVRDLLDEIKKDKMDTYKIKYWFKTHFYTHFRYSKFDSAEYDELFPSIEKQPYWLDFTIRFWLLPTVTVESEKDAIDKWSIHTLRFCWLFWTFTPFCKTINHKY